MKINLAQVNSDPTDLKGLLQVLEGRVGITCFPECFALGREREEALRYFRQVADMREEILQAVMETEKTVILPLVESHPTICSRFYNTTYVIHQGELLGSYRRAVIHPLEKHLVQPGQDFPTFEIGGLRFGILVCFEIAFPELARILALKGISVLFAPASLPAEADYLWKPRLVARAQDNQIFVVGVNRSGRIMDKGYLGKSAVISPSGETLLELGIEETTAYVDLDLVEVAEERHNEPAFREFETEVNPLICEYCRKNSR
jgi:omega-amidase